MIKVKVLLEKETANEPKLENKLAEIAGCDPTTLNTFKNKEKKEMKEFAGLIKIIKYLRPEQEFELMIDYSNHINPNFQTARYMLEYLDTNGLIDAKKELISKMIEGNNAKSKSLAKLYHIDQQVVDKELLPFEAIQQLSGNDGKLENKVVATIFSAYVYLDQKLYEQVLNVVDGIIESLGGLEDSYLENMYMTRLLLLKAEAYNRQNDIANARKFCRQLLDISINETYKAWSYLQLGNSYILSDFERANEYFSKGLELVGVNSKVNTNIKRSHNFLHNLWKKECNYLNPESKEVTDIHEVVFYKINKQETSEANLLLNSIDKESCTKNELAFHFYLKGLITNSIKDFTESIKYFNMSGDKHFKILPVMKLKQFNVDDSIIELLSI